jgi:nanoRNase/pAp phosphatase (c-di-AMP/oligoRNAs hydrolase)
MGPRAVTRNGLIVHRPRAAGLHAIAARFTPVLGKRFVRDPQNVQLLGLAHAAHAALVRARASVRGRGVNIFTQWVGDPDALGSAVVLKAILEKLGATDVRVLTGALGHPQNRFLVEKCAIVLGNPNTDRLPHALNCIVDTSPPLGMTNTGLVNPAKDYFFVADHHTDAESVEENCRAADVRRVRLAFVGLPVGSTSAFLAVLGATFGLLDDLGPQGRAAAALGIYTDTSALLHGPTPLDFRMFEILTRAAETQELLDDLRDYRVPAEWYVYRAAAIQNMESKGAVRIASIGYVHQDYRDVIAEVASDLLRIDGTSIAIAIAVSARGTEVSVRADSRLLGGDQQRIVRVIDYLLDYAFPGLSGFKFERHPPHRVEGGAFVPHEKTQQHLWKFANGTPSETTPGTVDHCRACAKALIAALEDLRFARPEEIQGLL